MVAHDLTNDNNVRGQGPEAYTFKLVQLHNIFDLLHHPATVSCRTQQSYGRVKSSIVMSMEDIALDV